MIYLFRHLIIKFTEYIFSLKQEVLVEWFSLCSFKIIMLILLDGLLVAQLVKASG